MKCDEIKELLSEYIDEVLHPNVRKKVLEHLRVCPSCAKELANLRQAVNILHSLGEVVPPPEFKRDLMTKIKSEAVLPLRAASETKKSQSTKVILISSLKSGPFKYAACAVLLFGLCTGVVLKATEEQGLNFLSNQKTATDQAIIEKQNPIGTKVVGKVDSDKEPEKQKNDASPSDFQTPQTNDSSNSTTQVSNSQSVKSMENIPQKRVAAGFKKSSHLRTKDLKITDRSLSKKASTNRGNTGGMGITASTDVSNQTVVQRAKLVMQVFNQEDFTTSFQQIMSDHQALVQTTEKLPDGGAQYSVKILSNEFGDFFDHTIKLGTVVKEEITGQNVAGQLKASKTIAPSNTIDSQKDNTKTFDSLPSDPRYSYVEITVMNK